MTTLPPANALSVPTAAFGKATAKAMAVARTVQGALQTWIAEPVAPLQIHPATNALHYGSACFEGLKAHRGHDRTVRLFRLADHVRRMQSSAATLCLPVPPADLLADMLRAAVRANLAKPPPPPAPCTCGRRCSAPTRTSAQLPPHPPTRCCS